MANRSRDWLAQAERDLDQAKDSRKQGRHEWAKVLDNFYVPSRYPNGHSEGPPFEHFGPLQSGEAIRHAGEILEFARSQMAE